MKTMLKKRITAFALVAAMVISLFSGFTPATEASAAISASRLTVNTKQRDDYNASLSAQALAYYTGNYAYDDISGNGNLDDLSGTELYTALHRLMTDTMTDSVSYGSLPEYWDYTDAENGRMGATLFYSDLCRLDITTSLNREHVWPKSYGSFYELGAGADLHHLRPADSVINSTRSNDYMGTVANRDSHKVILKQTGKTVGYQNGGVFEPLDNVKGDVARIFLYLYVKWQQPNLFENLSKDQLPPMDTDDSANSGTKAIESLATLLAWNYEDPVDAWEMEQNDLIQLVQGNRNVFIDYPELAWSVFGLEVPEGLVSPASDVAFSGASYDRSGAIGYTKPDMGKYDGITAAPTLDASAYKVEDGEYILFNERYGVALSANAVNTYYRQGNAYTIGDAPTADIVWNVKRQADGTVKISNGEHTLAVGSKTNLMFADTDPSSVVYATFNLLSIGDGLFYLGVKGKDNNYVSWSPAYKDFSTTKYSGTNADYALKFVKASDFTTAVGSLLTGSDIGTIVVEKTPVEISDGQYVIYNYQSQTAMSAETVAAYYRAAKKTVLEADGTVLNPSADLVWTVVNNGDGSFKLLNGGLALGMKNDGHSSADFEGEFTNWKAYTVKGNLVLYNVDRDVALWWGSYSNCDGRFQAVALTEENVAFFKTAFAGVKYGTVTPTPTSVVTPTPVIPTATPVVTAVPTQGPVDGIVYDAFNKLSKVEDVTDGTYILATEVGGVFYALSSNVAAGTAKNCRDFKAVELNNGAIPADVSKDIVWTLTNTENGWTLQDFEGKFLSMTNAANTCFSANTNLDEANEYSYYVISANTKAEGAMFLVNTPNTRAISAYVNGSVMQNYRGYLPTSSSAKPLYLFKFIEKPAYDIPNGTYVIYNAGSQSAISVEAAGSFYRKPVAVTLNADGTVLNPSADIIWTVTNNEDGTITISNGTSSLSMSASKNNLTLDEAANTWIAEKQADGTFFVKNASRDTYYIEYYAKYTEFSTYTNPSSNPSIFALSFIPATEPVGPTPTAVPTAVPTATPTAVPTATPTPAVEPVPDEPVGPAENWTVAPYYEIIKAEPATIAAWELTKVTSQKDGAPVVADDGFSTVEHSSGKLVGAQSINWNKGSYYEINTSTLGICDAALNLTIASTNAGPKYMQIMYKNANGEFVNMPGGLFLCTTKAVDKTFFLPADLYNAENVVIRIYAVGEWRADSKTGNMTGNNYLTGLSVTGSEFEIVKKSYVQITSIEQLTEMPVILVSADKNGNLFMLNKDVAPNQKNARKPVAVTEFDGEMILVADNSNVWTLVKTDLGYALRDADGNYLPMSVAGNACFKANTNSETITADGKCEYVITEDADGAFFITTAASGLAEKNIRSISAYINGSEIVDFRGYVKTSSSYNKLYIYRLADCELYGHIYDVETVLPTCTEDGYITKTCKVCGDVSTEILPATGHDYDAVVTEPTCTEGGYTTYTCSKCGDSFVADFTEALGHNYILTNTVEATTFAEGYYEFTCTVCGDSYRIPIKAALPVVVNSDWGTGFNAEVKVVNTGSEAIDGWLATFSVEGKIDSIWNAEIVSENTVDGVTTYVVKNAEWNRTIYAGSATTFGFNVSGSAASLSEVYASKVVKTFVIAEGAVEFRVTDIWNGGFNGEFVITNNTGAAITNWSLEFDFAGIINSAWNGVIVSAEGGHFVIDNANYNMSIASGASVSVGFNAMGTPDLISDFFALFAK